MGVIAHAQKRKKVQEFKEAVKTALIEDLAFESAFGSILLRKSKDHQKDDCSGYQ